MEKRFHQLEYNMGMQFKDQDTKIEKIDVKFGEKFIKVDARFDKVDEKFKTLYEEITSKLVIKVGKMLFIATGLIIVILGALIKL